jgi:ankyrin repeat protein
VSGACHPALFEFVFVHEGRAMARKNAAKQQQARSVMSLRGPDLSDLLLRATSGWTQDVKAYLDAGGSATALVRVKVPSGVATMPLIFAILQCHVAADQEQVAASAELLVCAGAPIDATITNVTANGQVRQESTALVWSAACSCCTLPLKTLLQLGADPCLVISSDGQTALHRAVVQGSSVEKIKLLIDADPEHRVDLADARGLTPLMHAAANGHLPLVIALHRLNAQLDATDKQGVTALSLAINLKQLHVATYLLRNGADPNRTDNKGNAVLHYAVQLGMPDAVLLLLSHGADSSTLSSEGFSAIFTAAAHGHVCVMKVLQDHGVDVKQSRHDGLTVLILAAQEGQLKAAEHVISAGVAVNASDKFGNTALHYAAKEQRTELLCLSY